LLTAKRHISDIPAIVVPNDEMKMTATWEITSYIHGDVLTIGFLFLIICLAHVWHVVYFLSQLSEKGYRFLLGLFFKIWGLEALVRQQSEMGSKLVLAMK
jgi:hypothetical protein